MNVREGMRRVGIVFGAAGCVAGGILGYWHIDEVWKVHAAKITAFERVESSPLMREVAETLKETRAEGPKAPPKVEPVPPKGAVPLRVPPPPKGFVPFPVPAPQPHAKDDWVDEENCTIRDPLRWSDKAAADDFSAVIGVTTAGDKEIQTVYMDKNGVATSIELTTGEWVHRDPKTLRAHLVFVIRLLLSICYPAVGFVVPWGAIKAGAWVADGFAARPGAT
jgi:hypothetical protein